MKPRRILL